jgi:plasmid stability protein
MKALTIRNIPDDLYRVITRIAKRNRRSLQQQVISILDRARVLDTDSPVNKAMAIRHQLTGRELGDTIMEIQEERNR